MHHVLSIALWNTPNFICASFFQAFQTQAADCANLAPRDGLLNGLFDGCPKTSSVALINLTTLRVESLESFILLSNSLLINVLALAPLVEGVARHSFIDVFQLFCHLLDVGEAQQSLIIWVIIIEGVTFVTTACHKCVQNKYWHSSHNKDRVDACKDNAVKMEISLFG
jgi:hypothetical protein